MGEWISIGDGGLSTWRKEAEMAGVAAVRFGKGTLPQLLLLPLLLGTCQGLPSTSLAESGTQLMETQSNPRCPRDMNTPPM